MKHNLIENNFVIKNLHSIVEYIDAELNQNQKIKLFSNELKESMMFNEIYTKYKNDIDFFNEVLNLSHKIPLISLFNKKLLMLEKINEILNHSNIVKNKNPNALDIFFFPYFYLCSLLNVFKNSQNKIYFMQYTDKSQSFFKEVATYIEEKSKTINSYTDNILKIKNANRGKCLTLEDDLKRINSSLGKKTFIWSIDKDNIGPIIKISIKFTAAQEFLNFLKYLDLLQTATDHHVDLTCRNFDTTDITLSTHQPVPTISTVDVLFAEEITNYVCQL